MLWHLGQCGIVPVIPPWRVKSQFSATAMAQGQMEKNHTDWLSSLCLHLSTNKELVSGEHIFGLLAVQSLLTRPILLWLRLDSKTISPSSICQKSLCCHLSILL
jgi:hypothetical protein